MTAGSKRLLSTSMFLNGFRISTGTPARASSTLKSAGTRAVPPDRYARVTFPSAAVDA